MASILKGRGEEMRGESLKHSSVNGVDIYMITSQQRSVPTWASDSANKNSRKRRQKDGDKVALLQDLWFEISTSKIKPTSDGEYLIASGIHPPQMKIYELSQLSMKCERHLDSEILDFEILSDDYSKMAFLCADRSISLHAKYGKHYTLRIPKMGRDIEYDSWSCDLLCAASSPDLYRLNLEQGRFLSPLTTQSPSLNVVSRSKAHGLVACGGGDEDGAVECFDTRVRSSVARINAVAAVGDFDKAVTAIAFDGDADYQMAVGTSSGKILIYDLRSSDPVRVKDHMYDNPILDIKWHRTINSAQPKLITTDNRVVRIWNPETGEGMTSIEPSGGKINDLCIFPGTGLILLALDSRQIPAYFIPDLGPAPKWSPRLQLWEELELDENKEAVVYDDFKFLEKEDLERLNLTNLIGTNLLRASLHGYFVDYRLYRKAKELANPFSYEEYMDQRKKEKLDKEHANRITTVKKLPKVNRNWAKRILDNEQAENEKGDEDDNASKRLSKKKKKTLGSDIFEDDRFQEMFKNTEYEIDETSKEYLALHPVAPTKNLPSMVDEHFESVSEDENGSSGDDSEPEASEDELYGKPQKNARVPRLHEIKDERHAEAFSNRVSLAKEDALALGERMASRGSDKRSFGNTDDIKFGPGGSREISFKSRNSAKYKEDDDDREPRREKRRGIQSLGLKSDRNTFGGGRGRGGMSGGRGRGGMSGGRGRGGMSGGRGGRRGRGGGGRGGRR